METPQLERGEIGRKLRKFVYRDNSDGRKVIFECVTESILDADKMYEEKTGKDPEKQPHVGCSIEKIEDDQT
ncbi:hypothetical protein HYV69_00690 [Candidatus Uhrbacteria bacterium]|nr:hypothetical protein [Candidatus Uhrbacteria bacterium]